MTSTVDMASASRLVTKNPNEISNHVTVSFLCEVSCKLNLTTLFTQRFNID